MVAEAEWKEELAKIQANLKSHGIKWNETSQPFITVEGTAQVHIKAVRSNYFIKVLGGVQQVFYCWELSIPNSMGIYDIHHTGSLCHKPLINIILGLL